jgi:hypothetical protein
MFGERVTKKVNKPEESTPLETSWTYVSAGVPGDPIPEG